MYLYTSAIKIPATHNKPPEMLIIEYPLLKLLLKDIELHDKRDYNYCTAQHKAINLKVNSKKLTVN